MVGKNNTKSNKYTPPMKVRRFVEALNSEGVWGNKTKAQEITGVDRGVFYYYLYKYPEFKQWYEDQCKQVFITNLSRTVYSTQNQANKGNMIAVDKILKVIGWLGDDKAEQNVNVNVTPDKNFSISSIIKNNGNADDREGDTTNLDAGEGITGDRFKQKV